MKNSSPGIKILTAVLCVGVLGYFAMQIARYFGDPLATTPAYTYQVEEGFTVSGYVVRDEQVLPASGGGLLQLTRTEGEKVSAGGRIALVYPDQASLDRQKELESLQLRLEQLEFAQEATQSADASLKLDSQIRTGLLNLRRDLTADRLSAAETHISELRALVMKRDYTYTEIDTQALSGEISQLQGQIRTLQSQSASVRAVTAAEGGTYSAVVDGYETVLTPERLETMTAAELLALSRDESLSSDVGKLIRGDRWYYAVVLSAGEAAELTVGTRETLRFSKGVDRDLEVEVLSIGPESGGRCLAVFSSSGYLAQVTLLRAQSADIITGSTTGIRIPKGALRATRAELGEGGEKIETPATGVYCLVGMELRFKPVEVLYTGDNYVLVQAASQAERTLLRPGDAVVVTGRDLYDRKAVS